MGISKVEVRLFPPPAAAASVPDDVNVENSPISEMKLAVADVQKVVCYVLWLSFSLVNNI